MNRLHKTVQEMVAELDLDTAIRERFKMERHPPATVDGDDEWDRDLFEEPE